MVQHKLINNKYTFLLVGYFAGVFVTAHDTWYIAYLLASIPILWLWMAFHVSKWADKKPTQRKLTDYKDDLN